MYICADAPLALLETDHLSVESGSLAGSHRELNGHTQRTELSPGTTDLADEFDFDICLSGSLSDLVVNFDDNVYCVDSVPGPEISQASVKPTNAKIQNQATLSQVKFWWREAVEEQPRMNYPLQEFQPNLTSYDDFESADADGITEDGLLTNANRPETVETQKDDNRNEVISGELPNSIRSSSNSLRSTTPDPQTQRPPSSLLVHTPKKENTPRIVDKDRVQAELNAVLAQNQPVEVADESNISWTQDLSRLSLDALRLYVEQLTSDVMNLSDQLVELLATRDELVMLREASDDFVILLNLVHQRRARASRAALLMTARTRVRPKMNLFRIYLPWTNRGVGLFSAVSSSSVFDSTGGLRSSTTSYHQVPSAKGGSGTLPHRYTDAVALNVATGSAAYYKALNLQSKQRRPRGAQLHMSSGNASANLCGVAHHPVGKTHPTDDSYPNGDVVKDVPLFSLEQINLSSPQAQQRLNALRQQCASLPWPNGQPQESQSLNLCLPYRLDSAHGITLATLRIINQILYGTLLENPATEKFIKTYLNSLSEQVKVSTWIDRNHKWQINGHTDTGHVADPIESVPEPLIQMA